jgi:hypothetical protein
MQANVNHAQRRAEEQCQAVPPCAGDLRLEFEEAGLLTFNSPRPIWARRWHVSMRPTLRPRPMHLWLRPGRHGPGGGVERGVQISGIYVEPTLAQPIQSACA